MQFSSTQKSYILGDGQERARLHPETFEVPSPESIGEIKTGDYVKLMFEASDGLAERMWVYVVMRDGDRFGGKLHNAPVLDVGAKLNDPITFEARHILDVMRHNEVRYAE